MRKEKEEPLFDETDEELLEQIEQRTELIEHELQALRDTFGVRQ